MTIFWITLLIVFLFSFAARDFSTSRIEKIGGAICEIEKPNKILTFVTLMILVLVSGLRKNIGDTYFYMYSYKLNDYSFTIDFGKDFGFDILQAILQKFSDDPQILVFICALLTNILIIIALYKYSSYFELAVFVYITSGIYLVTMNGIRQYLAASIIFIATKYILKRDWKKYFLLILFAATIHKSALILLPAYFIANKKAWKFQTIMLLFVGIIIMAGYNQLSDIIFGALSNTQYGHYGEFSEGGANLFRVMVYAAPLVLAYLGRERLERINPETSNVLVNMSIIGLFFMIISTQNWIFARMAIYFNLYNILLITWVVKLFDKKDQKIIYLIIISCYFLYYFYENVVILNIQYHSEYLPAFLL